MNSRLTVRIFPALIVLAIGVAEAALDRSPAFSLETDRSFGPIGTIGGAALGYATGFENPPFQPASLFNQGGWRVGSNAIANSLVATLNPFEGSQHLRLIDNSGVGDGTQSAIISPTFEALPEARITFKYAINDAVNGADYQFSPQDSVAGIVATRVRFRFTGQIEVGDDLGGGPVFVDTGATWLIGAYHEFAIDFSQSEELIRYFHDGQLIYTGVGGLFGAQQIDEFAIAHDNFQSPEETADIDNLAIVPEPTTGAIAACCGLTIATLRRRRHQP